MAETIVVTGATGFVGRHLVDALLAQGFYVRATARAPAPLPAGVDTAIVGDLGQDIDWTPTLQGADGVVHLAGIAHTNGVDAARYDRINHLATAALARAAARSGVRRFIFLSSVLAQTGSVASGILTEERPPAPASPYGESKLAAERALQGSALETVVLRPPLIYGGGVHANMARLVALARLPLPLPFAAVANRRSLLAVENLTAAIVHCLRDPRVVGATLLVADDTPLSLPAMIAALRAGHGRKPGLWTLPPAVLSAAARLAGAGTMWERLAGDLAVSNSRLRSCGWVPRVDSASGLAALAATAR